MMYKNCKLFNVGIMRDNGSLYSKVEEIHDIHNKMFTRVPPHGFWYERGTTDVYSENMKILNIKGKVYGKEYIIPTLREN